MQKIKSAKIPAWSWRSAWIPLLLETYLQLMNVEGGKSQFSFFRYIGPERLPILCGESNIHAHTDSTKWTHWVKKKVHEVVVSVHEEVMRAMGRIRGWIWSKHIIFTCVNIKHVQASFLPIPKQEGLLFVILLSKVRSWECHIE